MSSPNLIDKLVAVFSPRKGLERAYDRRLLNKYNAALPLNDLPEIFGMHEKANIAFNLKEANKNLCI